MLGLSVYYLVRGLDADVSAMQLANQNLTPIGNIGAALGCIASASVQESFAWVNKFNLIGYFPDIEMGFGDVTLNSESKLTSTLKYSSLNKINWMIWTIRDISSCANILVWKVEFFSLKTKHVQTEITEQLLETVQFISQDALYVTHYCLMSTLR